VIFAFLFPKHQTGRGYYVAPVLPSDLMRMVTGVSSATDVDSLYTELQGKQVLQIQLALQIQRRSDNMFNTYEVFVDGTARSFKDAAALKKAIQAARGSSKLPGHHTAVIPPLPELAMPSLPPASSASTTTPQYDLPAPVGSSPGATGMLVVRCYPPGTIKLGRRIARGGYGKVFEAHDGRGAVYAAKVAHPMPGSCLPGRQRGGREYALSDEMIVAGVCTHRNIVRYVIHAHACFVVVLVR
jgi:hypothetical protein